MAEYIYLKAIFDVVWQFGATTVHESVCDKDK